VYHPVLTLGLAMPQTTLLKAEVVHCVPFCTEPVAVRLQSMAVRKVGW
jgi:hypothetical protein